MDEKLKKFEGTYPLPKNASYVERLKYELCKRIVAYVRFQRITQTDLASKLGIDPARVSEIVHYRIEKFTIDTLLTYNRMLDPKFIVEFKPAI